MRRPHVRHHAHTMLALAAVLCALLLCVGPAAAVPTARTAPTARPWAGLRLGRPLALTPNEGLAVSARIGSMADLAYCGAAAIYASRDGGSTWRTLSTEGVLAAGRRSPFPPLARHLRSHPAPPSCQTVVADPTHARTYFATFAARRSSQQTPPDYTTLYVTRDNGRRWLPAPPPAGYNAGDFAAIAATSAGVTATYAMEPDLAEDRAGRLPPLAVETTTDGGRTWRRVRLSCPAVGPCVRFGPIPEVFFSQGGFPAQPLAQSADGGRTWSQVKNAPGIGLQVAELVAYGLRTVALVDGTAPFVLTTDGGGTWQVVALPRLPGQPPLGTAVSDLTVLPDGSLLAPDGWLRRVRWYRLTPRATRWQVVPHLVARPENDILLVHGGRLWWVEEASASAPATVESAPVP